MSAETKQNLLELEADIARYTQAEQIEIEHCRIQFRAAAKIHGDRGSYAILLLAAEIIDFVDGELTSDSEKAAPQ
jgi:hypothetical protein